MVTDMGAVCVGCGENWGTHIGTHCPYRPGERFIHPDEKPNLCTDCDHPKSWHENVSPGVCSGGCECWRYSDPKRFVPIKQCVCGHHWDEHTVQTATGDTGCMLRDCETFVSAALTPTPKEVTS